MKRILSSVLILPLLVLFVLKAPPVWFVGFVALIAALALYEFYAMFKLDASMRALGVVLGTLTLVTAYLGEFREAVLASVLAAGTVRLFLKSDFTGSMAEVAMVVLGIVYIPGLLGFLVDLRMIDPAFVLYMLAAVWGGDALAYYVGTSIGRHKLYPSISPNKTVEGAAASFVGGALGALVIRFIFLDGIPIWAAVVTGMAVGGVTILGDLIESMFKRDANIKDSGVIIPGHGGFLDKVDGSLFAAPVLLWLLKALHVVAS